MGVINKVMGANREEDKKINEMYLNQDAIGLQQQRNPNGNLKYPAKYNKKNSNLKQFAGLVGNGSANDAMVRSSADLSSDNEGKHLHGYIDMKSDQTIETPENPEIVIVGLYKTDLEYLRKAIKQELQQYSDAMEVDGEAMQENAVIGKLTDKHSAFITKVKALDDVKKQMASPQYKRKITLAKRR